MISKSLFGSRLRKQRKFLDLTQAQAAEKAGIERETWGKYERGIFLPSGDVLISFLGIGIDVSSLFAADERQSETLPSGLGAEEQELLALFHQSSELGRAVIMSAARGAEKKEAASAAGQVA